MSAPNFLTWEGDAGEGIAPYRPGTDDLGGDHFEDDGEAPPDPNEFPSAAAFNQITKQVPALAKVAAAALLECRFNAGAPFIQRATGPSSAIVPALFTVTDLGAGATRVVWPAGTFPTHQVSPTGLTVFSGAATPAAAQCLEISNGIEIRTFQNGVAADLPWTVCVN